MLRWYSEDSELLATRTIGRPAIRTSRVGQGPTDELAQHTPLPPSLVSQARESRVGISWKSCRLVIWIKEFGLMHRPPTPSLLLGPPVADRQPVEPICQPFRVRGPVAGVLGQTLDNER